MASKFPPNDGDDGHDDDSPGGLLARERQGDNAEAMTITEVSAKLKRTVEDQFGFVRLRGELSGVKRAASGHMYLALKDEQAVIDGVMWRGSAGRLGFVPEDGLEVIASGKLTTYPGRSKYQIVIERLEIAGEGALLALLEKTRARLEAEGLFAPERKRAIPFLPRVIGVVTSPTGAVIRDILHRLADRFPTHVLVWPVVVQGQGAADQIAAAVRGFSNIAAGGKVPRPDVVIVARGGGSIEDLWSFNEEVVVRAIAECSIPIISAVGHETDTTVADHAADRRAPTPTAAAEMAVPVKADLAITLDDFAHRSRQAIARPVALGRERLAARVQRLPSPASLLEPPAQKLDDAAERLRRGLKDQAGHARERLGVIRFAPVLLVPGLRLAEQNMQQIRLRPELLRRPLARRRDALASLERVMASLNPDNVLDRGYARVTRRGGATLTTKLNAGQEAALDVHFSDGVLVVVPEAANNASARPAAPKAPMRKPMRKKKPPAKSTPVRQEDLFG